ncbi:MAG: U32 family peptidase, partial [Clostridia bacterium]|nr:U32 family peptidase [Clostridia bacterium]
MQLVVRVSSIESVAAAVQTGADAVCLCAPDCGRKDCLSLSELQEALRYCRLRGVKAYVYFASLCSDGDLLRLRELVRTVYAAGADAAVAGDLGLVRMIRQLAPQLPIFGSEQLAVHDLAGALAAEKLGIGRVMLARELSAEQMRFISERAGVQTRAFCHGEQCVSYSGQ